MKFILLAAPCIAGLLMLLPMFKFNRANMAVKPGVKEVIGELRRLLDEWQLARWFAQPHRALRGQALADLMAVDAFAACRAARASRLR